MNDQKIKEIGDKIKANTATPEEKMEYLTALNAAMDEVKATMTNISDSLNKK